MQIEYSVTLILFFENISTKCNSYYYTSNICCIANQTYYIMLIKIYNLLIEINIFIALWILQINLS